MRLFLIRCLMWVISLLLPKGVAVSLERLDVVEGPPQNGWRTFGFARF